MVILTVENLAKNYGNHPVFANVSFALQAGERAALFGANGSGKTTVLRIVAGELRPDVGFYRLAPGLRLGYLPQVPSFPAGATLAAVLEAAQKPGGRSAGEALRRFGFAPDAAGTSLAELSSGQRTRAALARLWLLDPDLLLLDEPTNHLDLPGLELLAGFIREHRGAALLVSHDRYFLDQAAERLIELSPAGARSFPAAGAGAYTSYRRQKELEYWSQAALHEKQAREERRLEGRLAAQKEWARRAHREADRQKDMRGAKPFYRAKAKKAARRAKATAARLERLRAEKTARPRRDPRFDLVLEEPAGSGRRLIMAEDLHKAYIRELLGGLTLAVLRGERIGIIGPNGCGKTTLLRLLLGLEEPDGGRVWRSPSLRPCYLEQELGLLPDDSTVMACAGAATDRTYDEVRLLLGCLLFRGADVNKRVRDLSRGERVRLALARMLLSPANLLVLDEPTNHLDIPAREAVEEALAEYAGTLLLVSHDRYLIDRVCDKIVAFTGGGEVRVFPGTYREYEERRIAANQSGQASPAEPEILSEEERLVLENRLSFLAARLGEAFQDAGEKAAVEREFREVAARLGKGSVR